MSRGKGDYYRLGHGTVDHVRKPKLVEALAHKNVVSFAVGSLHCIVCTDGGEVFTWGDNDEGQVVTRLLTLFIQLYCIQIGDGTTQAAPLPKKISLSGFQVTRVACGSAHTAAWSLTTDQTSVMMERYRSEATLPTTIPLEYNLLHKFPVEVIRNRLLLLSTLSGEL